MAAKKEIKKGKRARLCFAFVQSTGHRNTFGDIELWVIMTLAKTRTFDGGRFTSMPVHARARFPDPACRGFLGLPLPAAPHAYTLCQPLVYTDSTDSIWPVATSLPTRNLNNIRSIHTHPAHIRRQGAEKQPKAWPKARTVFRLGTYFCSGSSRAWTKSVAQKALASLPRSSCWASTRLTSLGQSRGVAASGSPYFEMYFDSIK